MRSITLLAATALLLGAAPAMAADIGMAIGGAPTPTTHPVTVNDFTPAQQQAAFRAVRAKGYSDPSVTMFQAGNVFVRGIKDGQVYQLTVTPRGQVYASTPTPLTGG